MTQPLAAIDAGSCRLEVVPRPVLDAVAAAQASPDACDDVAWPGVAPIPAELVASIPAQLRRAQLDADPSLLSWLVRAIVVDEGGLEVVGHLGGHGAPDVADGSVEVGYTVAEAWRGRGLATAAARAWFGWAHGHGARRARLSTTRDNAASLAIAARLGLAEVGEVWDEDDQVWEVVFEGPLPLAGPATGSGAG